MVCVALRIPSRVAGLRVLYREEMIGRHKRVETRR